MKTLLFRTLQGDDTSHSTFIL